MGFKMSESERKRVPGEPEMTQAEVHSFIRRVQADLYFGPDKSKGSNSPDG